MRKKRRSFIYRNSLSIVLIILFLIPLIGQAYTGWKEYLEFLEEKNLPPVSLSSYLCSGHFLQSTFENWESEFLQMALLVVLTVFLRQEGSSESKHLDTKEEAERKPKAHSNAPWPVRKGGIALELYKNSLSLALAALFVFSFTVHWYGSWRDYNFTQQAEGKAIEGFWKYLGNHRFWFESFQNWQSEFFSVFVLTFLSIYLRQKGSPQSKPVDAPHRQTGG